MSNPCAACTHRCCHNHLVTVSGYDAWLIASNLRLAPGQFLVAVPQDSPEGAGFLLDRSGQTYDIALDKARARTTEKPCVFWIGLPGGIGRCGVYPFRPQVCQTYPAVLREGRAERREDVICPRPAWRDGTLRQPLWVHRLHAMDVEHDIYRLVAARWNHHVMHAASPDDVVSLTGYYDHVLRFYDRFEPLRARLAPDEWSALCERWAGHLGRGESPLAEQIPDLREWAWLFTGVVDIAELEPGERTTTRSAPPRHPGKSAPHHRDLPGTPGPASGLLPREGGGMGGHSAVVQADHPAGH